MKFLSYVKDGTHGVAILKDGQILGLSVGDPRYPGSLDDLIDGTPTALADAAQTLALKGKPLDFDELVLLPPCTPGKIICVGLNYADHAAEANLQIPEYPVLFSRFASSVIGAKASIWLPKVSTALDFEGELAAVIGKSGRYISEGDALDYVAGYSVFNDATIRDYQLRNPQWMIGKNFDGTGPFGPFLVTADELPPGASGLAIETRLNGVTVQKSSTDQLIFDVAKLIASISEAITLEPRDVIVTGTPSGVGHVRKPPLHMKAGDVVEVEIERIGVLRNPVVPEAV
ncbi:fumarylacetoacetate hydrolase family protein [Sphingobium sp. TKS]|uniref:fumarylacetoacetate hydrolase family protein n=1 Tax=Sphingobium sp. TKS TaxID=1315974 RepID=UPI0007703804|nr:fumarylacetoacetate hydrolase family protein [Sphingobium sp. TKS]AMK21091.1 5-carboxymethyl-2-hydroxymuconate delta-isomerase [Sphingobium sp. TKS]